MPAFNEEKTIARVVLGAQKHAHIVIVCDDGSSDLTGTIAERLGAVVVRHEKNRPQPRFDRDTGCGMSVVVGRIRKDPIMTFKYMCLGHNTVRGGAGAGILSAELYVAKGLA